MWEGDFQMVIAIIFHYHTKVSFHYYKSANTFNGQTSHAVLQWSVDSLIVQLERHVIFQYGHSSMKAFLLTIYVPCSIEDFSTTVLASLHFYHCMFQLWVARISLSAEESWAGLVACTFNRELERSLLVSKLLPTRRVDSLAPVLPSIPVLF